MSFSRSDKRKCTSKSLQPTCFTKPQSDLSQYQHTSHLRVFLVERAIKPEQSQGYLSCIDRDTVATSRALYYCDGVFSKPTFDNSHTSELFSQIRPFIDVALTPGPASLCTIVTCGESTSGRTTTLFGSNSPKVPPFEQSGLFDLILHELFARMEGKWHLHVSTFGIANGSLFSHELDFCEPSVDATLCVRPADAWAVVQSTMLQTANKSLTYGVRLLLTTTTPSDTNTSVASSLAFLRKEERGIGNHPPGFASQFSQVFAQCHELRMVDFKPCFRTWSLFMCIFFGVHYMNIINRCVKRLLTGCGPTVVCDFLLLSR
jgi:hypothetical protein